MNKHTKQQQPQKVAHQKTKRKSVTKKKLLASRQPNKQTTTSKKEGRNTQAQKKRLKAIDNRSKQSVLKIRNTKMNQPFNEPQAVQVASRIIKAYGGHINFYRLAKLLYLTERASWIKLEEPAIGGTYFSLSDGPMIQETTDAANKNGNFPIWEQFLQTKPLKNGKEVTTKPSADPGCDMLSEALIQIIDQLVAETHAWKNTEIKVHCHSLKEFKSPANSGRSPIDTEDILKAGGKSAQRVKTLQAEIALWDKVDALFATKS